MPRVQQPGLKPSHKLVQAYYAAVAQFDQHLNCEEPVFTGRIREWLVGTHSTASPFVSQRTD